MHRVDTNNLKDLYYNIIINVISADYGIVLRQKRDCGSDGRIPDTIQNLQSLPGEPQVPPGVLARSDLVETYT